MRTIGADLNKASGSFKVAVNSQAVDQLKTANSEELSAARAQQTQISQSIDVAYAQMQAQQQARSHATANASGHSSTTSVSDGKEQATGHSHATGTASSDSAGTGKQESDTTNHNFEAGGKAPVPGLALAAGKSKSWGGGGTGRTETGDTSSTSGQETKSTAEKLAELQSWAKQEGLSDSQQKMVAVSNSESLSLSEASQQLHSLSEQISHAEKVSRSLEQMDKRQATVENDLMLRSIQELNASMGDATYVQRLNEEQQREQITARAAHIMHREYGLSEEQTRSLLGAEDRFDQDKVHLQSNILRAGDENGPRTPGQLYRNHDGQIYSNAEGLTPTTGVGGQGLKGEVENELAKKKAEIEKEGGEVVQRVQNENKQAKADIAATTQSVHQTIGAAQEQSAPETVLRGLGEASNNAGGFVTGAINTVVEAVGGPKNALASPLNGDGLPGIRGDGGLQKAAQTDAAQEILTGAAAQGERVAAGQNKVL